MSHLANAGSENGYTVLQRLARKHFEIPLLRRVLHCAREQIRRQTWQPPTPDQLFRLAGNQDSRLVQSGDQLAGVVLESIARFQDRLTGRTRLASLLWAGDHPKREEDLSDFLEDHFKSDLKGRGIVVGREVRVQRISRIDLRIDAVAKNPGRAGYDTVQIFVEVKGCWHPEVKKAMKTQLLDRYLARGDCHHGIYLVGWFLCDAWTGENPGRTTVRFSRREELEQFLARQAKTLSGRTAQLYPVVLDVCIELPKRRKTLRRKRPVRRDGQGRRGRR